MIEDKRTELVEIGAEFDHWTSLISEIEKTFPARIGSICKVYDAFLLKYPLCYGYWKKYANHLSNHCTLNEVHKVYERAVGAIPYSVDIWFSYCSFGMLAFEDPTDIRRLFKRGLFLVSKDYSSYLLWDKYIEFEYSLKQRSSLFPIYLDAMSFPSKKLNDYYTSFKKLIASRENEAERESGTEGEEKATMIDSNIEKINQKATTEIRNLIKILQNLEKGVPSPNLIKKYLSVGEALYQSSSQINEKIILYENRIRRPYFHIKPLDKSDIENWHRYLDFVEMQNDFDWAVKLYERCLIPCACYSEFWIRYVEFVEAKGGRELARYALERAQKFVKGVPAFNHYYSMFMEKIGFVDIYSVLPAHSHGELDDQFINAVSKDANARKRMGDANSAIMVYEKALELAKAEKNTKIFSILCTKFAQLKFMLCNNIDPAIEVFMKGIQELPSKVLIQEMVDFVTVRTWPGQMQKLDSIIASLLAPGSFVSQVFSLTDREEVSDLYLQYVDLYGTIGEIRKAWLRHWKLFPHITERTAGNSVSGTRLGPAIDDILGERQMVVSELYQDCRDDGAMAVVDVTLNNSIDDILGERQMVVSEPYQDCRDNGTMAIVDVKLNNSIDANLIEVTNDTRSNHNIGREGQVDGAEAVETHSTQEKVDEIMEVAETARKQIINDNLAIEEEKAVTDDVNQSAMLQVTEVVEIQLEDDNSTEMMNNAIQAPPVREDFVTDVAGRDEKGNLTQKLKPNAREDVIMDVGISNEVSETHVCNDDDTKLSTPSQAQGQISPLNSVCNSISQEYTNVQQTVPLNASNSQDVVCYVPTSQSQQWQTDPQLQHAQSYPYQQASGNMAYAYAQSQPGAPNPIQESQGMSAEMLQYYQQQQCYYPQQYEHVLYIQQQQQQQLYEQQQQNYYTQQQLIIQQQHFQQLKLEEQQQFLQQHQQQFCSQMQQQVYQLQQQHELQLQQLQQQMPAQVQQQWISQQQQEHHQLPVHQLQLHTQPQQHANATDLSSNSIQKNPDTQKHSSNHNGSECEEPAVRSQTRL